MNTSSIYSYAKLKLKPSKCRLCQHEISYLGFKVTGDSIRPDEAKTACIEEWQFSSNITELRSLIGFLSYHRSFIFGFASRIEPLNKMLRKNEPIVPTERRLRAFNGLKSALLNAPALGIYRAQGEIIVDVDSSAVATGAVCQQKQDDKLVVREFASSCFRNQNEICAQLVEN